MLVACSDGDGVRFMFHAYVRTDRDGNERVGGSTQPAPKWLREEGTVYRPG